MVFKQAGSEPTHNNGCGPLPRTIGHPSYIQFLQANGTNAEVCFILLPSTYTISLKQFTPQMTENESRVFTRF
jgi:hypothetical protein